MSRGEWESAIESDQLPAIDVEQLKPAQRASELIMLQLRLAGGVELSAIERLSGVDSMNHFRATLERLAKLKLIILSDNSFCLTDKGIEIADTISAEFL